MKNKKYLKAAKLVINENKGCCRALSTLGDHGYSFSQLFEPTITINKKYNKNYNPWWFGDRFKEKNQLARSLALLFMYEMGEV